MQRQQAPILNINGGDADEILTAHIDAAQAVLKAFRYLQLITPHGRDYQTAKDAGAYTRARVEHNSRCTRLDDVRQELENIALQISDQRRSIMDAKGRTILHNLTAAPLVHEVGKGES